MAAPKAAVIRTAGINCDVETEYAIEQAGAKAARVHLNHLVADKRALDGVGLVVLPGGFSYGDDVASAQVWGVELVALLGDRLRAFVERGGLLMGICNGFQALVKTGFLPYAEPRPAAEREFTLAHNDSRKFECRWVRLRAPADAVSLFVEPGEEIELPVAHGEGKLAARDADAVRRLEQNRQIGYRYIAADGGDAPVYPDDPNGSVGHIAALSDAGGRVFGLMPHPERYLFAWHHPQWTRRADAGGPDAPGQGARLFARAVRALR